MSKNGIYNGKKVSDEEIERMKNFSYPFSVSKEVTGEDISGKTFLDIGCGSNTQLGMYVKENGGSYVAFDKQRQFLDIQQDSGFTIVEGDIVTYSNPLLFDIVHTRFVLMHIPPEDQTGVIRKILSISKERALFLEFDWNTFEDGGPVTSQFRDLSLGFMKGCGINPFIGGSLVQKVNDIRLEDESRYYHMSSDRFHREKDVYYYEIIPILEAMIKGMEKMQYAKLEDARELLKMLELEAETENAEKFIPPDIVVVTVFRSGQ